MTSVEPAPRDEPDTVRSRVDGPVATITLSRPQTRNAQLPSMWAALRAIGGSLTSDVRVVVVRGDGPTFSSGLDRRLLTPQGLPGEPSLFGTDVAPDAEHLDSLIAGYQEAFSWLRTTGAVSIAAVQGHAVGAGFQLALACDLRVLADDATFAMRETSLGLVPDLGGTQPLVEAVGYARALEICVTGREVGADEALQLGLATIVVPRDTLGEAVADLTAAVLAAPAAAVMATKALLRRAVASSYSEQLRAERSAQRGRIADLTKQAAGNKSASGRVADHDE